MNYRLVGAIADGTLRPEIDKEMADELLMPNAIHELIEGCLSNSSEDRPSFVEIVISLAALVTPSARASAAAPAVATVQGCTRSRPSFFARRSPERASSKRADAAAFEQSRSEGAADLLGSRSRRGFRSSRRSGCRSSRRSLAELDLEEHSRSVDAPAKSALLDERGNSIPLAGRAAHLPACCPSTRSPDASGKSKKTVVATNSQLVTERARNAIARARAALEARRAADEAGRAKGDAQELRTMSAVGSIQSTSEDAPDMGVQRGSSSSMFEGSLSSTTSPAAPSMPMAGMAPMLSPSGSGVALDGGRAGSSRVAKGVDVAGPHQETSRVSHGESSCWSLLENSFPTPGLLRASRSAADAQEKLARFSRFSLTTSEADSSAYALLQSFPMPSKGERKVTFPSHSSSSSDTSNEVRQTPPIRRADAWPIRRAASSSPPSSPPSRRARAVSVVL